MRSSEPKAIEVTFVCIEDLAKLNITYLLTNKLIHLRTLLSDNDTLLTIFNMNTVNTMNTV